jgi:hypothetical protein
MRTQQLTAAAGSLLSVAIGLQLNRQAEKYLYLKERLASLSFYQDTLKKVPEKRWERSTKLRSVTTLFICSFLLIFLFHLVLRLVKLLLARSCHISGC